VVWPRVKAVLVIKATMPINWDIRCSYKCKTTIQQSDTNCGHVINTSTTIPGTLKQSNLLTHSTIANVRRWAKCAERNVAVDTRLPCILYNLALHRRDTNKSTKPARWSADWHFHRLHRVWPCIVEQMMHKYSRLSARRRGVHRERITVLALQMEINNDSLVSMVMSLTSRTYRRHVR